MSDSLQDVYAKYLQHRDYGYPLRKPEPMSTLPDHYQNHGLQIGDVGVVDREGQFDVLFNICKDRNNVCNDRGVPDNFQPIGLGVTKSSHNAMTPGPIQSQGIRRILPPDQRSSADYEFELSASAGAILILPQSIVSETLSSPEEFRKVATQQALYWYEFARRHYRDRHLECSLYLITGFYKTCSWSLGIFDNSTGGTGTILAQRDASNPNAYLIQSTFPADRRHHPGHNINQTIFITGFKITVKSWFPGPLVLQLPKSESHWSILVSLFRAWLKRLRSSSRGYELPAEISVEDNPHLSQPFHPSDIINRFLLNKNPNAQVAVLHDSQWMDMMKEGLTHEDLLQEDRLDTFLSESYTVDSEGENTIVSLRRIVDGAMSSVSPPVDPNDPSPELEKSDSRHTAPELEVSSPSTPSLDDTCIVITRIRAQNILSGFERLPVGFYVLVQFGVNQQRTRNRSIGLNVSTIEWEDKIVLSPKASDTVRFTVYASFELEPMLGNGEALYTSECRWEQLDGGTYLINFSQGESGTSVSNPSLLITLGRRCSDRAEVGGSGVNSNLVPEASSVLVRETDLGQGALLRYYKQYRTEDIKEAVHRFEGAWRECPLDHPCRAAVLVNLAKAKFMCYQIKPTSPDPDEAIQLYRQAVGLRCPGHPDRPATVLQLAQILLFRYEKQGCEEPVAREIKELLTASHNFVEDSHERRAADLVLETLERCKVVNSGSLTELDELVLKLKRSAMVPPDGYFDRPQRLINLSITLLRRYEHRDELSDLDLSLEINKQALQLLQCRYPDRLSGLRTLYAALWRLFEIHGDLSYLRELIKLKEEALQFMPEGHLERLYWVTNPKSHRAEMLERLGDGALEAQNYGEAIAQYSRAIVVLRSILS